MKHETEDLAAMLAALITKNRDTAAIEPIAEREGALICAKPERAQSVAELLATRGYEVAVAESAATAVTRMRETFMRVVILDAEFAREEDGAACVRRMLNQMTVAERRRVFAVGLSNDVRTMDAHAAFIASLNLIVNTAELASLPDALQRTRRAFAELYAEFEKATNRKL